MTKEGKAVASQEPRCGWEIPRVNFKRTAEGRWARGCKLKLRNSNVCMGRANTITNNTELRLSKSQSHAPLAQSVEHAAVNRSVVGSSPTRGAIANMATHR